MVWQPQPAHVCSAQTLALAQAMRDLAASARREAASLEEAIERGLEDVRLRELACAQRERNVDAQEAECDHQRRAVAHLCDVVWAQRRRGLDAKQTAGRACSPHRWLELLGADENDAGRVRGKEEQSRVIELQHTLERLQGEVAAREEQRGQLVDDLAGVGADIVDGKSLASALRADIAQLELQKAGLMDEIQQMGQVAEEQWQHEWQKLREKREMEAEAEDLWQRDMRNEAERMAKIVVGLKAEEAILKQNVFRRTLRDQRNRLYSERRSTRAAVEFWESLSDHSSSSSSFCSPRLESLQKEEEELRQSARRVRQVAEATEQLLSERRKQRHALVSPSRNMGPAVLSGEELLGDSLSRRLREEGDASGRENFRRLRQKIDATLTSSIHVDGSEGKDTCEVANQGPARRNRMIKGGGAGDCLSLEDLTHSDSFGERGRMGVVASLKHLTECTAGSQRQNVEIMSTTGSSEGQSRGSEGHSLSQMDEAQSSSLPEPWRRCHREPRITPARSVIEKQDVMADSETFAGLDRISVASPVSHLARMEWESGSDRKVSAGLWDASARAGSSSSSTSPGSSPFVRLRRKTAVHPV